MLCYAPVIKRDEWAKVVKHLNFAFAAAVVLLTAAGPATAQLGGSASTEFIAAVRQADGAKATELLRDKPTGLVNAKAGDGDTGLIIAIQRRDDDWTGFLLNQGADPNLAGKAGETPLIAAARNGFDSAIGWLIGSGAKIDAANKMGETALIVAAQQREPMIVRLLLSAGADPDKTDNAQGYSARDYATRDPRARDILKLINDKKPKS